MLSKSEIRTNLLAARRNLSEAQQLQYSTRIMQQLTAISLWRDAQNIASYFSYGGEVKAELIFPILFDSHKKGYLPCITAQNILQFREYERHDVLHKNQYGILEVSSQKACISLAELDCVLVPLVAFTERGERLGMGKGYYDKTFATSITPILIGVAYEIQRVDQLPMDTWDLKMDLIITEERIYECP